MIANVGSDQQISSSNTNAGQIIMIFKLATVSLEKRELLIKGMISLNVPNQGHRVHLLQTVDLYVSMVAHQIPSETFDAAATLAQAVVAGANGG